LSSSASGPTPDPSSNGTDFRESELESERKYLALLYRHLDEQREATERRLTEVLGQGVGKVILALVFVQWAYFARAVRAAALVERGKEYVEAAQCLGLSRSRILFSHLLPNCLPPVIVIATIQVAHAIAAEATLSFLGIGLPITEPSLGLLIANGYQVLLAGLYWISVFPGLLLLALIFSINIVGDRLREALNPRLQK